MSDLRQNIEQLFPTRTSFIVFWAYISLFVCQGLLVKAVQGSQIHGFNTAIIVLLTEALKLIICLVVYLYRSQAGGLNALLYEIKTNSKLFKLYLVPAFLYCLYNNLTFINLELFDLATYYCLLQFRVVLTAIIYQILFQRKLTALQWVSLFILTAGCLVKEYSYYNSPRIQQSHYKSNLTITYDEKSVLNTSLKEDSHNGLFIFILSTLLLLFQMFCSCFAGVYNEFLLKDSSTAKNADIILQNIFMYFDSIVCNLLVYALLPSRKSGASKMNSEISLASTFYNLLTSPLVLILIVNNALSGLVASFFLKSLNSILKTFASALEVFVVTFFAWILFSNEVDVNTIIALVLVSVAIIIYAKNPVSVAPPGKTSENRDGFILLPTEEE